MSSTREFEFRDGTSDKFWKITLDSKAFTVSFGRRGTGGQSQTKKWASEAEARKNHDKLIAEKTKKGYVEAKATKSNGTSKAARGEGTGSDLPLPLAGEGRGEGTSTERRIDLSPGEWAIATWRKLTPPKEPIPAPFDRDACDAKLRGLKYDRRDGKRPDLSNGGLPGVMSREEAHYWFLAMTSTSDKDRTAKLASAKIDGRVTFKDVHACFKALGGKYSGLHEKPETALVLSHLLSPGELAGWLLEGRLDRASDLTWDTDFLDSYRRFVAPFLASAEVEKFRAQLRPQLTQANWPADAFFGGGAFEIAAALGMHDELRPMIESWKDDRYAKNHPNDLHQHPMMIIFGLGDPALVEKHVRRLRLSLRTPQHVAGWLAHTEWRALDVVTDSILKSLNKKECEELIAAFAAVKAPEAAGPMLQLSLKARAPKGAREWLDANPGHVAAAKGQPAKEGGRAPAVAEKQEAVLKPYDEKATPAWLAKGVAAAATQPAPTWVKPGGLPPLAVDGRQLSDQQISATLAALQASTFEKPHPLVADLRKHADPASADEFAWKLFERWLGAGASSKEKWAMAAMGALGGDPTVAKLTPMVRAWPGESQHPRAVLGLQVLRAIGSDAALMALNGIAQKLKFQALKAKARELMEEIAKDKGLTRGELEDRMVPDFDLDERGRRVFDFGARRFNFVFGPELKPMVRDDDEKAKLRDNLPDPGPKDDAAKAAEAIEAWKSIKKQIKDTAKLQADRLEQAMVTGRRWKTADFQTLVVRHPLMTHLARLLLWGVYDGKKLRETFRVTEDQEFVNADDEPYKLRADAAIGLVHPLQLDDRAREAWGQRFSDYALIPPFPQLGRSVHKLEKKEEKRSSLDRFDKLKLPAPSLVFTLEKLGWTRGNPGDAGVFSQHSRHFQAAKVIAVVNYEGNVAMGYIDPNEEVTITGCAFVGAGEEKYRWGGYSTDKALKLGDVDPIVLSETLHDLTVVASKAKS